MRKLAARVKRNPAELDEALRAHLRYLKDGKDGHGFSIVETLLAVVIVVLPKAESPAWHLCCPHCHTFTLVRIGSLARAPPACTR